VDQSSIDAAADIILGMIQDVEVDKIYMGTVKRVTDYGAFVEILPGKEGLLHISKLDVKRVTNVTDIVNIGDKVKVKVLKIDDQGRIDLSRKDALNS
jgi:polyribonucleotide nucleotidyltransferase